MTRILKGIPGEFEHQENTDQAENRFCNRILNQESQACQGDDRPSRVTHKGAELNIQGGEKSACRSAANRLSGDDAWRSAKGDRENE